MTFRRNTARVRRAAAGLMILTSCGVLAIGCAGGAEAQQRDTHTSGSREADQRADQRMAKTEQLTGGNNDGGKKTADSGAKIAEDKKTLYERIGGAQGADAIVNDLVGRLLADPQVNFERKGITRGGIGFSRGESLSWDPNARNVASIKKYLAQFISLKTGGPVKYDGPDFEAVAKDKQVKSSEFEAAVGDLQATLDKLKIANQEQKELLALMESTRQQFVTER